ncbi:hypothetical protein [Brevundimonas sp. DC300-4]|uniref:hypothetical protein n=1 Tax=Brevundimonas sp. DC300-4 TaxID=2804594 RepID=UPI003CF860F1
MSSKRLLIVVAMLLGSCAVSGPPDSLEARQLLVRTGQCFRGEEVNNFNVKDGYNAYVSTRRGYVYRLESLGDCFDEGVISLSVPHHRLSNQGICVGEETAVYIAQWRGGIGQQCVARVSGPIRDSRVSGLWSRQN